MWSGVPASHRLNMVILRFVFGVDRGRDLRSAPPAFADADWDGTEDREPHSKCFQPFDLLLKSFQRCFQSAKNLPGILAG